MAWRSGVEPSMAQLTDAYMQQNASMRNDLEFADTRAGKFFAFHPTTRQQY